jgi:TIR domain
MNGVDPQGFHAIVQEWPPGRGRPRCRGFVGLPLARATRIMVASDPGAEPSRALVLDGFRAALLGLGASEHRCGGPANLSCWATDDPAARNILVVVAEAPPPSFELEQLVDEWSRRGFEPLAVVPAGADHDAVLPQSLRRLNSLVWRADPREVLPDLVDAVILEAEDRRIFVSYARVDGSATAERVFDVLQRLRFDVFLDRFRLPPGADFLVRIQDEILDKSMVVVIETAAAIASDWVRQEVNVAAARRLGLAAVNLAGSVTIREIDEVARCRVDDDDELARFLLEQHRVQLLDRREALRDSVYTALRHAGLGAREIADAPYGFVVDSGGRRRLVGVSVRPADLHRFRLAYEQASGADAFLIHPQPALHRRRRDLSWLSDVSGVVDVDEGRIDDAAAAIVAP